MQVCLLTTTASLLRVGRVWRESRYSAVLVARCFYVHKCGTRYARANAFTVKAVAACFISIRRLSQRMNRLLSNPKEKRKQLRSLQKPTHETYCHRHG